MNYAAYLDARHELVKTFNEGATWRFITVAVLAVMAGITMVDYTIASLVFGAIIGALIKDIYVLLTTYFKDVEKLTEHYMDHLMDSNNN